MKDKNNKTLLIKDLLNKDKGDTWPKVLAYNYKKYGSSHKAMRHKHYGIWHTYTWEEYYTGVKYLALGLLSLGFKPGNKLLIIGDNAPEWYHAELAAQAIHGIPIGLYSDLSPMEVKYIAENSEAEFAVAEDQEQVDKFLEINNELPLLKKIIYWNYKGLAHYREPILAGYKEIIQQGKEYGNSNPGLFEQNIETGKGEDVCAIVYTSGTTGTVPKGAVHTYNSMRAGSEYYLRLDPLFSSDNIIPYRPPAWMTEQWFNIGCHLLSAGIINFAESPETQQRDIKESIPSVIFYSARLWESQASGVYAQILEADAFKNYIFKKLMPAGYSITDFKYKKQKPGLYNKILYWLADMLLFRPIKSRIGLTNARICYTTESVLSPEAFRFYHSMNIPLKSIYSSTEGGVLACSGNGDIDSDTSGPDHNESEIKITESGELVCRQPGIFTGYYNDPDKTKEVLKDGWFYSGDCCSISEDGHIVFVERLNDIIKLADGSTIAPQSLESSLRFSPYINDAWILAGPSGQYASAIIVIDFRNVARWAGRRRINFNNFAELSQKTEVYDLIKKDIERVNNTLPGNSQIKRYLNLHKTFSPDEAEQTRTRNLRRSFLEDRYSEIIEAIYSDKNDVPIKTQVTFSDGRTETLNTSLHIKTL